MLVSLVLKFLFSDTARSELTETAFITFARLFHADVLGLTDNHCSQEGQTLPSFKSQSYVRQPSQNRILLILVAWRSSQMIRQQHCFTTITRAMRMVAA